MTLTKSSTQPELEERLAEILEQYLAELQAGRAPSKAELLARHPELAEDLEQCLASLDYVGAIDVAPDTTVLKASAGAAATSRTLGDFRIVREIGRGGMGVVYEAEQISLHRRVALKILPFANLLDPRHRKHFTTEAQAAAMLHHQNIVPVYQVGCERGVHYYAMQYVDGGTLAEVIRQFKADSRVIVKERSSGVAQQSSSFSTSLLQQHGNSELSVPGSRPPADTRPVAALSTQHSASTKHFFESVARLGIQAAEALEHAHQAGIIHRDIKPGNLLVEAGGKLWITDFGLARMEADRNLTISGDLLGTIRYMSPEQALARSTAVDHRTDIYSLGATLYELLTLEPPISGEDRAEILHQIAFQEPPAPRRINRRVPMELETIVLKALNKTPEERYATAQEIADDLQRFLHDRPIQARRPNVLQRVRKWRRRHRHVVTACLVLLAVILVTVGPLLAWHEWRRALEAEQTAMRLAEQAYVLRIGRAKDAWDDSNVPDVLDWLALCVPGENQEDLRGVEWHMLHRFCEDALQTPRLMAQHMITSIAVSADGRYLAACGADLNVPIGSDVTVWDLSTRKCVRRIAANAHCVAFSADGGTLVTGHRSSQLRRWSVASGKEMPPLEMQETAIPSDAYPRVSVVQCSADGKWVSASDGATIFFAGLETASLIMLEQPEGAGIQDLVFSPDSQILLAASSDGRLWRWRTETGQLAGEPCEANSSFSAVAYAPSGKVLAAGEVDGSVSVWDADSGGLLATLPADGSAVTALVFVYDDQVALSKEDKTVTTWKWATGQQSSDDTWKLQIRRGHAASITSLAYVPHGNLLISAGKDRQIMLWDANRAEEKCRLHVQSLDWGPGLIDISADSRMLSIASMGDWQFWDLPGLVEQPRVADSARSVHYSPDGLLIATTHYEPRYIVRIWDASTRELLSTLPGFHFAPDFSPDRTMLVTGYETIDLWDIANPRTPRKIGSLGDHGYKCAAGFFPNSNRIAAGGATQTALSIWDATGQKRLALLETGHPVRCVAVSPDEKLIAIGTMDSAIQLWDVESGQRVVWLKGHGDAVYALDFTSDGKTLASGSLDGTVKLWNVATSSLLFTIDDHPSPIVAVKFSPDGQYLVTGSQDGTILVRRASP